MHELAGNAARRDQIEPAAGGHAALFETENAGGDGVTMMKIVKQPAVQGLRTQFALYGCNLRRHCQASSGRAPNRAVPRRIWVAPSSMAIPKSWDMPMESSGSGQSRRRAISSRTSRERLSVG